jgi:hypothetical protein
MPACSKCNIEARFVNSDGFCSKCWTDRKTNNSKSTFVFSDETIPILQPIVHFAKIIETTNKGLEFAKMYCGLVTTSPLHKYSFKSEDVTCRFCISDFQK